LLFRLTGKLYNKARIAQFEKICKLFNVQQLSTPLLIKKTDVYLSGLIDSNGTFALSVSKSTTEDSQISGVEGRIKRLTNSKGHNQIFYKVTSVDHNYLKLVQKSYDFGKIYIEKPNLANKSPTTKYHLTIKSYNDFQWLYEFKKKIL